MARSPASIKKAWRQSNGGNHKCVAKPFVGVDGEGCGVDSLGRQCYMLLRAGDMELFTGEPLGTADCLSFLLDTDSQCVLVGFAFGYDVTMILRDLPPERRERLLQPLGTLGDGKSRYTYWKGYGLEYLPKQYFRVCRLDRNNKAIPGSSRTVYETFGFFQCSFLKACKNFGIRPEYLELIEKNKAERENFTVITPEIREYCKAECEMLAELMEHFRENCDKAGIKPQSWNGAGKLAAALHRDHDTLLAKDYAERVPVDVRAMAHAAYYGGRFEVTRIGSILGPIHEYDINSAYPAAMLQLPCLEHGEWREIRDAKEYKRLAGNGNLYIADIRFAHDAGSENRANLYGLPVRSRHGHIFWPGKGCGIYWSCELQSARLLGCRDTFRHGWVYERHCSCQPFAWVETLYEIRKALGKKTEGYPIKLGINSLYGKLAQRIGNPRWGNFVWAGLITAMTRARLNMAIAQAPEHIVMLATDGVYSRAPLNLPIGEKLGQWEHAEHARMFVVQPGLYWGPPKPKTRGIPPRFFETRTMAFEEQWRQFYEEQTSAKPPDLAYPVTTVALRQFIGLKLAQSRGKPDTAGKWIDQDRQISYDWTAKRGRATWQDGHAWTMPLPGSTDLRSVYHSDMSEETRNALDAMRNELIEMPDYVDLSAPWKD